MLARKSLCIEKRIRGVNSHMIGRNLRLLSDALQLKGSHDIEVKEIMERQLDISTKRYGTDSE